MLSIQLRARWKPISVWVLGVGATMFATVVGMSGLYDTPAKIRSYAEAVSSGDALVAINGNVAGVNTLGGVIANEFGFLASFAIPFMAVSLVALMTRKDEEQGRLEAVLAGRIGRSTPVVTALAIATAALTITVVVFFLALVSVGVPPVNSGLYAMSMGALGLVFATVTAVAAQLIEHTRGVHGLGLGTIVAGYLLRGIGDVQVGALTWLSPLGWQEKTRAFGDQRWWPLIIPVIVATGLAALAFVASARRDLGSALIRPGSSNPRASTFLRTPLGMALSMHRGTIIGWTLGTLVIGATFGALAEALVDAIEGNASLAEAIGATGTVGTDAVLAMTSLILALLGAGYAIQAIGVARAEESSGRLETALFGPQPRTTWVSAQLLAITTGIVIVTSVGALALGIMTVWSTGHGVGGDVVRTTLSYMPAITILAGLAMICFGILPRFQPLGWVTYAAAALIAYLGDPLNLPDPVRDLSPFHLIGSPPQDTARTSTLVWLLVASLGCVAAALLGFRRRDIPKG